MTSLIPAWVGKLTAHSQANALLRRIRNSDFRQFLKAATPRYIDNVLYIGDESAKECSPVCLLVLQLDPFLQKICQGWIELINGLHPIGRSTLFSVAAKLFTKAGSTLMFSHRHFMALIPVCQWLNLTLIVHLEGMVS